MEWVNLGVPGATEAELKAKIRMPNGDWESADINLPLLYDEDYTHCEIDPQLVLGVCASLIPYPRNTTLHLVLPVELQWSSNLLVCQVQTIECAPTPRASHTSLHATLDYPYCGYGIDSFR